MAHVQMVDRAVLDTEFQELKRAATRRSFTGDSLIFAEGAGLGYFYIIESGAVAIHIDKSGVSELVAVLSPGSYFGEMAILAQDKRMASAMALGEVVLSCVSQEDFRAFLADHPLLATEIGLNLARRNQDLLLKEKLLSDPQKDTASVSFKGDPSLRNSAFLRDRYKSVVDGILEKLQPVLEDLLLNRCVYKIFLNLNSGEIRTCSIFEPFKEEIHTAGKFINKGYIDRHFSPTLYTDKVNYIRRVFDFIAGDPLFCRMETGVQQLISQTQQDWSPVPADALAGVIAKLPTLRGVDSFYLRNISISILEDVIRMQFNCDGTHFVSNEGYQQFIEENL
jgi:hypothetical protein